MQTNTQSNSFLQKLYIQLKTQSTLFTSVKIYFLMLILVITACSKADDSNITQNCPDISIDIKADINDKTKVIVTATSSITDGITYTWKVTDKNGSKEVDGNLKGNISWELEDGETIFCVTIKTSDCTEGVEKCITYNLSCENKTEVVVSRPKKALSKPAFKDGYMYYAVQEESVIGVSKLVIYKLNLSDKNATPIEVVNVEKGISGKAIDMVFKDEFLYVSVSRFVVFSKVFKIDTSLASPKLIEVLSYRPKAVLGISIQGTDMYAVSDLRPELLKFDLTKPKLIPMELTTIGKKDPFIERTIIHDMVRKGNELYLLGSIQRSNYRIIKIDLNDPNLEQKIIVKDLDRVEKIELHNDDLYFLFKTINNNGEFSDSWISKLNTLESSPSVEKLNKEFDLKKFDFGVEDLSFDKDFMYITINNNTTTKDQNEIVKVPICSLK